MKKKPNVSVIPSIKQAPVFNLTKSKALSILQMNNRQLLQHLKEIMNENPCIQFHIMNEDIANKEWYIFDMSTLKQELMMQLHTLNFPISEDFANFMIESLDENGFLTLKEEDYCRVLGLTSYDYNRQLRILQNLEPAGVFAKNSIDAVRIQLEQDGQDFALQIFMNYQNDLIHQNYTKIAKSLHSSIEDIGIAIEIIQEQNPFPCINYSNITENIYPDITVQIKDNHLYIRPINILKENFTDYTAAFMNDPILHEYFSQSKLLMEDINRRNRTLLLVANELCMIQEAFFLKQKPLVQCRLCDIAEKLGIHTSTVSRCIKNKYYVFQNQLYPLHHLLLTSTVKDTGNQVVNALKELIASERKEYPYSDYELQLLLKKKNITISRRTIAKYRHHLGIDNAYKRKTNYTHTV